MTLWIRHVRVLEFSSTISTKPVNNFAILWISQNRLPMLVR